MRHRTEATCINLADNAKVHPSICLVSYSRLKSHVDDKNR